MHQIPVALLGATGLVGQKAIALIERHPNLKLCEVAASNAKAGQPYIEAVHWRESNAIPGSVRSLRLKEPLSVESPYVISALPAEAARIIEPQLAERGQWVFSNASAHRMSPTIPILIPEINLDHLSLLDRQTTRGKIITNSNCTTAFIALALAPFKEAIQHVSVVTMQAISGAGYKGIDSMEILGNIIPHISGEEEKIHAETRKILGTPDKPANFGMTVHVHRVPVLNGHTVVLHVHLRDEIELEEVISLYRREPKLYHLYTAQDRPQPARDIEHYDQCVHIGRVKHGANKDMIGLIAMGNNLVRGAAGASILNLEQCLKIKAAQ